MGDLAKRNQCYICGRISGNASKMKIHILFKHFYADVSERFKGKSCHICDKTFGHTSLVEHIGVTHNILAEYVSPMVGEYFSQGPYRQEHGETNQLKPLGESMKMIQNGHCHICDQVVGDTFKIREHLSKRHFAKKLSTIHFGLRCGPCGLTFRKRSLYLRHMGVIHNKIGSFLHAKIREVLGIKETGDQGKKGKKKTSAHAVTSSKRLKRVRQEDQEPDVDENGTGLDFDVIDVNQNEVKKGERSCDVVDGDYSCEDYPCDGGQVVDPGPTDQQGFIGENWSLVNEEGDVVAVVMDVVDQIQID